MPRQLTAQDARQSLTRHAAAKGEEIQAKYGPQLGWPQLLQILEDRTCVRYPCEIVFDASALQPGELARPVAKGKRPEDGFKLFLHPHFRTQLERVVGLVLYQLVLVNYGAFASADAAEAFGTGALDLSAEEYYASLCRMADEIAELTAVLPFDFGVGLGAVKGCGNER